MIAIVSCIGLGPNFSTYSGLGWVSQLMGWVGSGHTKWTHGQLCVECSLGLAITLLIKAILTN